jgi:hypothetical protein
MVSSSPQQYCGDHWRLNLLLQRKMTRERYAEISTELSKLLLQQTEFFRKRNPTPAEIQEFKRVGERIRKLFSDLEKASAA